MKKTTLLTLVLLSGFFCSSVKAQLVKNLLFNSYDNIVRLDFSSGSPVTSYTGLSNGYEAIAHAEDGSGNIIFWVNSNGVYDANFTIMPGSTGILADPSSAEIVICPFPTTPNKYYVIYNAQTCSQLYYSVVDMTLRGGKGDVTTKDSQFANESYSEGLEIVRISCGAGAFRLLAFECNTGFYSFDVTDAGVSNRTLLYSFPAPGGDGRGELDYDNGKLATCFNSVNAACWGDYDVVSNKMTNFVNVGYTGNTANGFYGIEASPDGKMMYVTAWYENADSNVFLYDAATGKLLNKWKIITVSLSGWEQGPGQIEIASDGNLYMINNGAREITVFTNPNSINPTISQIVTTSELALGLSDHIKSDLFQADTIDATSTTECFSHSTHFKMLGSYCNADSIVWDFGDPGGNNRAVGDTASHTYSVAGSFKAFVRVYHNGTPPTDDTVDVMVTPYPTVAAPSSGVTCLGKPAVITATGAAESFYWSNGTAGQTATFPNAGTYTVTASTGDCSATASVTITYNCDPYIFIGNAFSPNADGRNDKFRVYYNKINSFDFKIFNRWGELVYASHNPDEGWDGLYHGQTCPVGSYVFIVSAVGEDGTALAEKGNVTLLR